MTSTAAPPVRAGDRRRRTFKARHGLSLLAFLTPAAILVAVFVYYPLVRGANMAFRDWNLYDLRNTPFVGLGNFRTLLADPTFVTVFGNSVVWVIGSIVPQFVLGFGLALLLRRRFRLRGIYQALVFYPWAVSGFLIGILFRWMFNGEFGVINDLLRKAGLIEANLPWLADPRLAMFSVIVANVWYGVTFFAIMILAALQSVPDELIESAAIDGATKIKVLWHVMVPYIRYTIALTIMLRVIWIFNFPDLIYGMTGGGPANQTQIATTWMIQFVQNGSYGLGSALGLILMVILGVFTMFYLMALRRSDR